MKLRCVLLVFGVSAALHAKADNFFPGSGNVGIGTSTPILDLDVRSNGTAEMILSGFGMTSVSSTTFQQDGSVFRLWRGLPFSIYQPYEYKALSIDRTARVGIGPLDPDANYRMIVSHDMYSDRSMGLALFRGTPGSTGNFLYPGANAKIAIQSASTDLNDMATLAFLNAGSAEVSYIATVMPNDSALAGSGHLTFWTANNNSSPTEKLRIQSNGNIGVGTPTPQTTLDVNGTARLARYSVQPYGCDLSKDGAIAATHIYTLCICKYGTGWVSTNNGISACVW